MKTPWEDLVNKGSNFMDFVRFRAHTYTRTQQELAMDSLRPTTKVLNYWYVGLLYYICKKLKFCNKLIGNKVEVIPGRLHYTTKLLILN